MALKIESCPIAATRVQTGSDAPACGSVQEHLPTLPLAENMCVRTLQGVLEIAQRPPEEEFSKDRDLRRMSIGWLQAEVAAASDPDAADHMMNAAYESNDAMLDDNSVRFFTYASAALLDIHLPTLEARWLHKPYEAELPIIQRATASLLKKR